MLNENELEEIRRKLRELEEEPPVAGWQNIQKQLKPRQRWRLFWWVPLVLLLLVGTGVLIVQNRKADTGKITVAAPQSAKTIEEPGGTNQQPTAGLELNKPRLAPTTPSRKKTNATNKQLPVKINSSGLKISAEAAKRTRFKATIKSRANKTLIPPVTTSENTTVDSSANEIFKKSAELEAPITDINSPEKENLTNADPRPNPVPTDSLVARTSPDSTARAKKKNEPVAKKLAPELSPAPPGSWAVGLFFAPRYTFRMFTPNTQDEILITRIDQQDTLGPRRMGYEFGLNVSRAITTRLHLEAGLSFMQLQENVAYSFTTGIIDSASIFSELAPDGSVTVMAGYVVEDRRLVSTYTYGGLRLGGRYYLNPAARHRYSLTFAVGANLLVKGRTRQFVNTTWIETVTFPSPKNLLEQSNYNLLLGAGYHVPLRSKYEFMVMPAINYFLGSTYKKREPFGLRPYSFGLTVQVKKIFQK